MSDFCLVDKNSCKKSLNYFKHLHERFLFHPNRRNPIAWLERDGDELRYRVGGKERTVCCVFFSLPSEPDVMTTNLKVKTVMLREVTSFA